MEQTSALSSKTLGQIALMQGMVAHLPDQEKILQFICRGLADVPGVNRVHYGSGEGASNGDFALPPQSNCIRRLEIKLEGNDHGVLIFHISDDTLFSLYLPFIENLGNMLAVVFEERRQRALNESLLEGMEKLVLKRTKELELENEERKQVEKALKESEENLRITLNSIGDAVISTNTDGKITRMNPVAESLTGWQQHEAVGQPLADVFRLATLDTRDPVEHSSDNVLGSDASASMIYYPVLISKSGVEYRIAESSAPIRDATASILGSVLVFRDVTEELQTTQELLKIKKLESVGVLAGGIAHDFNNLLTGLFGYIEMAKITLPAEHKSREFLESAGRAMDTAIGLTKQLLTFARGGEPVKEVLALEQVLSDTAHFAARGNQARLICNLAPDLWSVSADKGQLSQVITNLIINAEQAMPTGGRITLAAENCSIFDGWLSLPQGNYVKITVQDEGVGIAPQYLEQVFDPYFTTKQKGSGLGLATAHAIISKHNGRIIVDSQLNHGTTFTIYLPATGKTEQPDVPQSRTEAGEPCELSARILVMDDEEAVREVIGTMLEKLGHRVQFAVDGEEAIASYAEAYQQNITYDIVITDLTIPGGMGGQEVAQKIIRMDQYAKLIVSSGYATDPIMANYEEYGFKGVVVKPYRLAQLQKVVQQVLKT